MDGGARTSILAVVCAAVLLAGAASAEAQVVFKLAHTQPRVVGAITDFGALKFAELVRQKTSGRAIVDVFPGGALGGEREAMEGVSLGTVDMTLVTTSVASIWAPRMMIFDLPYLFVNRQHTYKTLDGPIGAEVARDLENRGMTLLAYYELGFRGVLQNKRPIEKPEDLSGVKLRVMQNPVLLDSINSMGGQATPMPIGEVFSAIQTGVLDGCVQDPISVTTFSFQDVTKYFSYTFHEYGSSAIIANKRSLSRLSAEDQKAVRAAAGEASNIQRSEAEKLTNRSLEVMGKKMQINYPKDLAAFREKVKPMYEKYGKKVNATELIARIVDEGKQYR